jgi:purine-binding chemotaxis protein CheW
MSGSHDVQAVTFGLGDEIFALPVGLVREIRDYAPPSRIPSGPAWLIGLSDVRGSAIPTVDLRVRLGLAPATVSAATRILVVDIKVGGRTLPLALVVDIVKDVASFSAAEVGPVPDIGIQWSSEHIAGVMRQTDGFVLLLDAGSIFLHDDDMLAGHLSHAA